MVRSDDGLALRQWLPHLEVSPQEIRDFRRSAEGRHETLFTFARSLDDPRVASFLSALDDLRKHTDDIPQLIQAISASTLVEISGEMQAAFARVTAATQDRFRTASGLVRHLYEEYGLLEAEGEVSQEDKVLLSTLHSSKGLEARVVFILHLDDRFIPNPARDRDEELRVLYVGMTRAKQELELSFTERFDLKRFRRLRLEALSPLLREILPTLQVIPWNAAS